MSFHPRMYSQTSGFEVVEEVRSLLLDRMVVDYWRVRGAAHARGHYVSMHPRFVFFLDGTRILLADDRMGEPIECAACFIPAGMEIRSRLNRTLELRHVDVHLSLRQLKELIGTDVPVTKPVFLRHLGGTEALTQILLRECKRSERRPSHSTILVNALLMEFFHQAGLTTKAPRSGLLCLAALRAYVLENLDKRIAVSDLAAASEMSRSHFNRVFRAQTRQSPYQWVLSLRVEHAKSRLLRGYSFVQAADAAGFADQAHFNRVFKATTGHVPTVWMNEHEDMSDGLNLQDAQPL